ncbi:MAG TPA: ABC transporter substrate-binding protein [Pseudolabrys sp.]|nr:ABC transporter substrate-binding protein [Pseudolabrys sp.]
MGGGLISWPVTARTQQSTPVIGFLNSGSADIQKPASAAYLQGLKEAGFVESKNILIESRWADGQYERLPELCADLIKRNVAIIMAGGPPAAQAAKKATSTIPVVFTSGEDPVQVGLVASINRPGGNLTGIHVFFAELETKKLGLLREVVPQGKVIAALVNSSQPRGKGQTTELQEAAKKFGQQIQVLTAESERDVESAFARMAQMKAAGLVVASDPSFNAMRKKIVGLAERYAIPAVYEQRGFVTAGGLMSYGTSLIDAYRQAGIYTGRILKGEKPADMPVMQPTKFEFVLNMKTAKALGLTIPSGVVSIADEVIE